MSGYKRTLCHMAAIVLILPILGVLPFTTARAATETTLLFRPTADAIVRAATPNTNYGTGPDLRARGNPIVRSYLRFSVSGLSGLTIQRAILQVHASIGSVSGLAVRPVSSNNWSETGITYNNAPAFGAVLSASSSVTAGTWVNLDVTKYVKAARAYSMVLTSPSATPIVVGSREAGRFAPRLVLKLASSTTSTGSSIKHVFLIVMENHSYNQVWNTSSTPYITNLGNTFARATAYHALTHPSLPNYLDIYAGNKYGISSDCSPSSSCHINARSLADNLDAKGLTWRAYMESMPAPCYLTTSGDYAPKHNPFVYFDDIRTNSTRCKSRVVPFTAFAGDLGALSTTPNFAFISPNLCSDMHDCSISTGDNWLKSHVPAILSAPACTVTQCLVIVTWDEDNGSSGNHVLTIFAGTGAKTGATTSASYTHYSLLHTVEYIFGVPTQTSNDAGAAIMKDMLR